MKVEKRYWKYCDYLKNNQLKPNAWNLIDYGYQIPIVGIWILFPFLLLIIIILGLISKINFLQ